MRGLFELTDLRLDVVTTTCLGEAASDFLDQLAQHEAGIADDSLINRVVLVDIAAIAGDLDHRLARGNRGGESAPSEAAADAKHQIRADQEVRRGAGHRVA